MTVKRIKRVIAQQALLADSEELQQAVIDIDILSGTISEIHAGSSSSNGYHTTGDGVSTVDGGEVVVLGEGQILLPGLIDCHVHLNQPGRTAWEGFQTGTLAAISGGVTTLIDMPLNSIPPTTTVENLEVKRREARETGTNCDVGFWGGIIPGNEGHLRGLLDAGVKGFKCFLIDSGVDEFPCVTEDDLIKACDALEGTNALILFHAEMGSHLDQLASTDHSHYDSFLKSRPPSMELTALDLILSLCRRYPSLRFHIVHLSTAESLPIIREARSSGVSNLTVETCFHYLTLRSEDIPPNATQFKCCPPIRDEKNRQLLKNAVIDGEIDFVISDHSPCIPEFKKGDFQTAWGGISCLGLGLSLMYTEFKGEASLGKIVSWISSKQAGQVGLKGKKGEIKVGADADFIVFEPEKEFEVTQDSLLFKNKVSPYIGKRLQGYIAQTYLRGQLAWDGDRGLDTGSKSALGVLV